MTHTEINFEVWRQENCYCLQETVTFLPVVMKFSNWAHFPYYFGYQKSQGQISLQSLGLKYLLPTHSFLLNLYVVNIAINVLCLVSLAPKYGLWLENCQEWWLGILLFLPCFNILPIACNVTIMSEDEWEEITFLSRMKRWHFSLFLSLLLSLYQMSFFDCSCFLPLLALFSFWLFLPISPFLWLLLLIILNTSFWLFLILLTTLVPPFSYFQLMSEASDWSIFSYESIGADVTDYFAPGPGAHLV